MSSQDEVIKMKKRTIGANLLLFLLLSYFSPSVSAQSWVADFDSICAQVEFAESLPTANLKELIAESDKLLGVIETSNDPRKKVYIFRLKKCRSLFEYIMNLRETKDKPAPQQ
jgi:hypothetical protein